MNLVFFEYDNTSEEILSYLELLQYILLICTRYICLILQFLEFLLAQSVNTY